ncbi:MAG: hypothetical protein KBC91_03495 [Candidatus Omnitrophica bacterium]|nr:hypothetical protein [Candidatus Omnitrophota bacterium]
MKKMVLMTALFAMLNTSLYAVPSEPGAFRIELREKKAIRDTEIIPFADNGVDPRKNIKVRVHTTKEVWAFEKTPDAPDVFQRDLGIWESDLIVSPRQQDTGNYPVDLIMSLRLSSGTVKRVERHLEIASAQALDQETNALDQLRNDFVDLVRNQYWPVDENLSEQFDRVLINFAAKHMRKMTDELPAALEKQVQETDRRVKILDVRSKESIAQISDFEASIRAQFKSVLKENEKIEEDTDYVQVDDKRGARPSSPILSKLTPVSISPQYSRRIQFDLTALALNGVERYRVAEVVYHEKTIQFDDGQFRTNFRLDVRPMMRERYSISKNFEHEGVFNEKIFLESWKNNFWKKASARLINAGKTEQDKAERAYIVTVLEPIIFSEQYAFPEFLAKAKYSFQSASTQKELRKLRKKL